MNTEQLTEVLKLYETKLTGVGIKAINRVDGVGFLDHVCFMTIEAQEFVNNGRIGKANRWLGFIQGVLWAKGIYTVDKMKDHNRK